MKNKFLLFIETPEKQIESHTERAMASVNVANCGNGFWLHFQFVGDNERLEVFECVDCVICAYKTVFCRIVCNGRKSKRYSKRFVKVMLRSPISICSIAFFEIQLNHLIYGLHFHAHETRGSRISIERERVTAMRDFPHAFFATLQTFDMFRLSATEHAWLPLNCIQRRIWESGIVRVHSEFGGGNSLSLPLANREWKEEIYKPILNWKS